MASLRQRAPAAVVADEKISLGRLFTQDLRRHDDEREESAARERVRLLDPVPAFLLAFHLVCAGTLLAALPLRSPMLQ